MPEVSLLRCGTYDIEEVFWRVKDSIDLLGGIGKFVKRGQKVLIKPNILAPYKVERAATTHPAVVEAVIRIVKEAGGRAVVGESPGIGQAEYAARVTGILAPCKKHAVPFVDLKTQVEVENPRGERFKKLYMAKEVLDADVLINLPKFKTHGLTAITGAVKNLFGCVPGITKSQYHYKVQHRREFGLLMLDIYRFLKAKTRLCIMDGIVAMDGDGPSAGKPYQLNLIGASADQEAIDRVFCRVAGIDPKIVPTLTPGNEIKVVGDKIEDVRVSDFKSYDIFPEDVFHLPIPPVLLKKLLQERPVILKEKCTNCGTCIKVCASSAIKEGKDAVQIDYDKCIRCFCCAEFCPEKAIYIKRNRLVELMRGILRRLRLKA